MGSSCETSISETGGGFLQLQGLKLGAASAGSKIKADTRQSGVTAVCIPIDLKP